MPAAPLRPQEQVISLSLTFRLLCQVICKLGTRELLSCHSVTRAKLLPYITKELPQRYGAGGENNPNQANQPQGAHSTSAPPQLCAPWSQPRCRFCSALASLQALCLLLLLLSSFHSFDCSSPNISLPTNHLIPSGAVAQLLLHPSPAPLSLAHLQVPCTITFPLKRKHCQRD